jgi:hypothetical protein
LLFQNFVLEPLILKLLALKRLFLLESALLLEPRFLVSLLLRPGRP